MFSCEYYEIFKYTYFEEIYEQLLLALLQMKRYYVKHVFIYVDKVTKLSTLFWSIYGFRLIPSH